MIQAKRLKRIKQYDVQVTCQPAMLKGVIQNEDLAFEFFDGDARELDAISSLEVGAIGQVVFQYKGFIIWTMGRPISPTGDDHADAMPPKPARHPFDHRRLASASQSEVPD